MSRVMRVESQPGDCTLDVVTELMDSFTKENLVFKEHSNYICFMMQATLTKRPRYNGTSTSLPCSWRMATTSMFPALTWRSHKKCSCDGGCLFHKIVPEEGKDCADEIVAFLRTPNDAFLRRFYKHHSRQNATMGRLHARAQLHMRDLW